MTKPALKTLTISPSSPHYINTRTILNKQYILNITDRGNKVQFHTPHGNTEMEITKEGIDRLKKMLKGI